MQVDVLTLRYDSGRGTLDDRELRAFVRDKVVLTVRDHFFQVGRTPHLALVIEHRPPSVDTGGSSKDTRSRSGSVRTEALRESLGLRS